ncbi:MAG: uracil-DNA glycosylase [Arcobacteraceae bacterium]|jgi:DNA polymerase|nr:uracil-DNA glycosylase [Arcobacteraceae bacterium]
MTKEEQNKILHNLYLQKSFGYRYIEPFELKIQKEKDFFYCEDTLQNCTLCDASKLSKTRVFGIGNLNSEVMFLTTVPSFDESSFEMFSKMLENVLQIPIQNIYLCSIIKCDISEKNLQINTFVEKCKGYIENQIKSSKAKIVVTLGDSYHHLFDFKGDLSNIRGTTTKLYDKICIPIYHPSFLLRNPSLKKETFEDLKKIKILMEQL